MEKSDFIKWARKLQAGYAPSDKTKSQLSQVDLIAIVGPTGVGKSTLINHLGVPYVMSDVSRVRRADEKDGKNYNFRSDYLEIIDEIKKGDYVQFYVSKYEEFYGTHRTAYPHKGICTMAIIAQLIPHFHTLGFRSVKSIYIMPPSYVEWMRRIGDVRSNDLLGRISEARESILLAQEQADDYHFVLNDVIELAVKDIRAIIAGEQPDQHRAQLAYDTADIILERIGD